MFKNVKVLPFCVGLNVLTTGNVQKYNNMFIIVPVDATG